MFQKLLQASESRRSKEEHQHSQSSRCAQNWSPGAPLASLLTNYGVSNFLVGIGHDTIDRDITTKSIDRVIGSIGSIESISIGFDHDRIPAPK